MPKNANLSLGALALLAGSIVMLFFVVLSGVTDTLPLSKTYFLRASTRGITGARDVSQWTYFYACGLDNTDCGGARAAPPFGFAWDSDAKNVPDALIGSYGDNTTSYKFYYLWRFGWVFILLALIFEVFAFFAGFLACCGRLGAAISYFVASIALFCFSIAVSLTTVTFVMARDQFKDENRDAEIGTYAFGFLWGAYTALIIADILFGLGMRGDKSRSGGRSWRKRSTRSRRSFENRRVKDEYP